MAKKITIQEIANICNVSKTLVSNYLNGKFNTMSVATRQKIEQCINENGYKPSEKFRNHKQVDDTLTIGLVVADITDPFYAMLCKGISDACLFKKCHVLIANSDNNVAREKEYIQSFSKKVDGLLISTAGNNDEFLNSLKNEMPIVLVDRNVKGGIYDYITSNNYESVNEMIRYLDAIDYEVFGLFTEELGYGMARTIRVSSFENYFKNNKNNKNNSVHIISIFDEKSIMKEVIDFYEKNRGKKMVIFGVNGRVLLQVISCIKTLDLRIPEDIGVCGYDDFDWARLIQKGITTICQPTYEIGYSSVEILIKRIQGILSEPEEVKLRSKIIIRGSV